MVLDQSAFARFRLSGWRGSGRRSQIFKGSAKGKVYFVDHEVLPYGDELAAAGIDLEDPDEVLAFMVDVQGCFNEVAKSFSDLVNKLVVYDEDGRTQIGIRRPLA
jgi:hypothetical protein